MAAILAAVKHSLARWSWQVSSVVTVLASCLVSEVAYASDEPASTYFSAPLAPSGEGGRRIWVSMSNGDAYCQTQGLAHMESYVPICEEGDTEYMDWDGGAWTPHRSFPEAWTCLGVFGSITCTNSPTYDPGGSVPGTWRTIDNGAALCLSLGHPGMQSFLRQCGQPATPYQEWTGVPRVSSASEWRMRSSLATEACPDVFQRVTCRPSSDDTISTPTRPDTVWPFSLGHSADSDSADALCREAGRARAEYFARGCPPSLVDRYSFFIYYGGWHRAVVESEDPDRHCQSTIGVLSCTDNDGVTFPRAPGGDGGFVRAYKPNGDEICRLRGAVEMAEGQSFCPSIDGTLYDWDGSTWVGTLRAATPCVAAYHAVSCIPAGVQAPTAVPLPRWAMSTTGLALLVASLALPLAHARDRSRRARPKRRCA